MRLVSDNFTSDADAELESVLVVVESNFDIKGNERVLVGDRHVEQVGCEFALIQWAACSLDPVAANLTIVGKLVDDGGSDGMCSDVGTKGGGSMGCWDEEKN